MYQQTSTVRRETVYDIEVHEADEEFARCWQGVVKLPTCASLRLGRGSNGGLCLRRLGLELAAGGVKRPFAHWRAVAAPMLSPKTRAPTRPGTAKRRNAKPNAVNRLGICYSRARFVDPRNPARSMGYRADRHRTEPVRRSTAKVRPPAQVAVFAPPLAESSTGVDRSCQEGGLGACAVGKLATIYSGNRSFVTTTYGG